MPQFQYVAYQGDRRLVGTTLAPTPAAAASQLRGQGYVVTSVTDSLGEALGSTRVRGRLGLSDKITLVQNLGTFLASGVPIVRALELTAAEASPVLARVLETVLGDLKAGQSLAVSLGRFADQFDPITIALIEAGEATGQLVEIFKALSARFKQDARTISKVRSAFVYPGIVFGALIVLGLLLAFFVLPRVTGVFERFAIDLPLGTKVLISTTKLLNAHPLLTLLVLSGLAGGTLTLALSHAGATVLRRVSSHVPGIRQVFWNLDLERFTSTLAILIDAGVPIQRSLSIAARTVTNPTLAAQIPLAARRLSSGESLATVLAATILPHSLTALLAAGEESGTLAANLRELESFYHDALDDSLRNVTALVEPILTLLVGLAVGAVVVAVIVPIYQLVGQLNPGGTP